MSNGTLTVLAIDDDAADAELLGRTLRKIQGLQIDFVHVPSLPEAENALARVAIDVVFLDYRMGAHTGLELLQSLRGAGDLRPIICFTQYSDHKLVKSLLQAGADDYLLKGDAGAEMLRHAIDNATARHERRLIEKRNADLLCELQTKSSELERNNRRLAELYETAHQFVDNVSHEFRTPLTVIKEFSSIMRDGLAGPVNPKQSEYLGIVIHRTEDLSLMVDDMLDMSRLEAGLLGVCRKPCSLDGIIKRILTTLERRAAASKVVLDIMTGDELPNLYCDPDRVAQVIINLMVNAIKFSPERGHVRLWTSNEPAAHAVRVNVTDEGPGIAREQLNEIFERFKQLDCRAQKAAKGFGLGLNIAKELVHLNLGEIGVESEVGKGSTFHFTLPYADSDAVVRRFLANLASANGQASVSCIMLQAGECAKDVIAELDSFVHYQVQARDLVFPIDEGRWLLVLNRPPKELHSFVVGIERSLAEANRNRPGDPLPRLDVETIGTWSLPEERAVFLEQFHNAVEAKEAVHAG